MSGERQRNLRLQGRHSAAKKKSFSPPAQQQQQANLPHSSNASCGSYEYNRTETVLERRPKPPLNMNEQNMVKQWIEISHTEKGPSLVYFDPDFMNPHEADYLMGLLRGLQWQEREIFVRGEKHLQPRLVHWIGPYPYKYSSLVLPQNDNWPDEFKALRQKIENLSNVHCSTEQFNSVLCNLYRCERDSVAWHSDNEISLGVQPFIASVSFGGSRKFEMRRKFQRCEDRNQSEDYEYHAHLGHGSLFIMTGAMQDDWVHRVPKEKNYRAPRYNLTFRTVYPIG